MSVALNINSGISLLKPVQRLSMQNRKSISSISFGVFETNSEKLDIAMRNKHKDLEVIKANASSADSKITDFDVAKGETEMTKLLINSHADLAKAAQINIDSNNVKQLF
jgi:hypothetical protein